MFSATTPLSVHEADINIRRLLIRRSTPTGGVPHKIRNSRNSAAGAKEVAVTGQATSLNVRV